MKLKNNTRVIIADSEKYLLLRNQGDEDILDLRVMDYEVRDNPPTRILGSDRPGRYPASNKQKSAVSDSDWHEISKVLAAKGTASKVNDLEMNEETLRDVIIIADSKTLGVLKKSFSETIREKIVKEIPKDLTHHTIPQIEKIIMAA